MHRGIPTVAARPRNDIKFGAARIYCVCLGSPLSHEGKIMKFSSALKLNHIFRRLYATAGHANGCLVLYARRNRTGGNRIGITVGKKLGHAVVRNRVRRRIREVYRLNEEKFLPGWDIVVVARTRAITADFSALTAAFLSLAEKAGFLKEMPSQEVSP